ncbi:MAG: glutamate 5-kinase [Desulfobacteraceae bacterium]|nr:glutamate 5-kinase [Desulfobacteraceae bacterium]
MEVDRTSCFKNAGRVVIKVGSGVLTGADGLNTLVINSLSRQICELANRGVEVLFVSSGAMAAGQKKIGLARRPDEIPKRQAIAAVGQAGLILCYENAFAEYGRQVAQVLLTSDDLSISRRRYLNARNTLHTLLSWNVVPIINENDTVVVEEIKFGDNDNLSALIALMMNADILVNLTDIDGLYTGDPCSDPNARQIPVVADITREIEKTASGMPGVLGTGGMLSKIRAARKVSVAGIPMVIAGGMKENILLKLFEGQELGTFFLPSKQKLPNRKSWIGFTLKPRGAVLIDEGAARAIMEKGKSLLPGGITGVEGEFGIGAPVHIIDSVGRRVATGLVNYSSSDIKKIRGCRSGQISEKLGEKPYDEVIHRNNMTVLLNGLICDQ